MTARRRAERAASEKGKSQRSKCCVNRNVMQKASRCPIADFRRGSSRLCSTANPDVTQSAPLTSPQRRSTSSEINSSEIFHQRVSIIILSSPPREDRSRTESRTRRALSQHGRFRRSRSGVRGARERSRDFPAKRRVTMTRTPRRISSPISSDLTRMQPCAAQHHGRFRVSTYGKRRQRDRQAERERERERERGRERERE